MVRKTSENPKIYDVLQGEAIIDNEEIFNYMICLKVTEFLQDGANWLYRHDMNFCLQRRLVFPLWPQLMEFN